MSEPLPIWTLRITRREGRWSLARVASRAHHQAVNDSMMIEVFRALGDPVRWTIMNELRHGTRCACALSEVAEVSPSLLSHHLKTLREAGLITGERRGRWIDYSLAPDMLERLSEALLREAVLV